MAFPSVSHLTVTALGCRNCLGQQLAKINVPTAVAMLTREFHMTLASQVWRLSQLVNHVACNTVNIHKKFRLTHGKQYHRLQGEASADTEPAMAFMYIYHCRSKSTSAGK